MKTCGLLEQKFLQSTEGHCRTMISVGRMAGIKTNRQWVT